MLSLILLSLAQYTSQHEALMEAIIMVESSGNPEAVGDNGNAIGCMQIWKPYHYDSGVPGKYENCFDVEYSKRVFDGYMKRYAKEAWTNPKKFDPEKVARIHNGGPRGYRKKATEKYWVKVKRELKK